MNYKKEAASSESVVTDEMRQRENYYNSIISDSDEKCNAFVQKICTNEKVSDIRKQSFQLVLSNAIGKNATVLYAALVRKHSYYYRNNMLDDGWFYSTFYDMYKTTLLSDYQQRCAVESLTNLGLIRCNKGGKNNTRHFYVNHDGVSFNNCLSQGVYALALQEARKKKITPAEIDEEFIEEVKNRHLKNFRTTRKETQEPIYNNKKNSNIIYGKKSNSRKSESNASSIDLDKAEKTALDRYRG